MNFQKILATALLFLLTTTHLFAQQKDELLFYVGITMVKPLNVLAQEFEKKHNCKIKILQGGSQDLYESIKMSQQGDLYLPGSNSYRVKNLPDGILLEGTFVGYNKMALVVQKGNPKNIKSDLNVLTNPNYRVVLGHSTSGSAGKNTKKILKKFGNYQEAMLNTIYLAPDSRYMTNQLRIDAADIVMNWYATTFWEENKDVVEAIIIDEKYAEKSKLVLNLLKTSKNKELTKKFMQYASSKEGQAVFQKYGFLDPDDIKNFAKVTF